MQLPLAAGCINDVLHHQMLMRICIPKCEVRDTISVCCYRWHCRSVPRACAEPRFIRNLVMYPVLLPDTLDVTFSAASTAVLQSADALGKAQRRVW
jgi:hypothetical protein